MVRGAINARENREAAAEKTEAVVAELRWQRMSKAAEMIEERIGETLACHAFPGSRWIKLRANNPLERSAPHSDR